MSIKQPLELALDQAIGQAPIAARHLHTLAEHASFKSAPPDRVGISRYWISSARTYCYHTHIAISGLAEERFEWVVQLFYAATELPRQPWYKQFLGGEGKACEERPAKGIEAHQLCLGRFDLGLGTPRAYRQLVSLNRPSGASAVIVARSVPEGPALPEHTKLAYTLDPNGEVLQWDGKYLHWHHICCTPGAALMAQPFDRYFINGLRILHLDGAERKTYREEAQTLRDWLQRGGGV
jgi:hypothetical protein